jgi:hypothetical protein
MQVKTRKNPCIPLDFSGRIWTFQRVTEKKIKNRNAAALPVATRILKLLAFVQGNARAPDLAARRADSFAGIGFSFEHRYMTDHCEAATKSSDGGLLYSSSPVAPRAYD